MKSIVIFGAGIAGLSAAHELAQLGYTVSVYEATDQPGGFFRSSRLIKTICLRSIPGTAWDLGIIMLLM